MASPSATAWQANKQLSEEAAALLKPYENQRLCARCSRPDKQEIAAGVLRYSKENMSCAVLPSYSDTPFHDATEAEIALVRLTIPCVELKVLKHGGTLSKTHSVCVPNEVTKLRKLPRTAAESGVIYYSKPGRLGTTRKFEVRPSKVY